MYKSPKESIAIKDRSPLSAAEVAGPPSPEKPTVQLPATFVITPLGDTFTILPAVLCTTKTFPEASRAIPIGKGTPERKVVNDSARGYLTDSATEVVCDKEVAGRTHGDSEWFVQGGRSG
jgi:hypothetical protein